MERNSIFGSSGAANLAQKRSTGGPPKKLVIKPFKEKPQLPEDFEEKTWAKLQEAVVAVHSKKTVGCSLEELYRAVEDMCVHKKASLLYTRLQEMCDTRARERVAALHGRAADPVMFLHLMDATWQDHCEQTLMIRSIFLYLDRTYVIQSSGVRSLWDLGLDLFRSHFEATAEIARKVVQGLLTLVAKERQGESIERSLVKSLLRMFSSLGLYADVFERPFVHQTQTFYAQEGERLVSSEDVPSYLCHCERRFQEEQDRTQNYLDNQTRKALVSVVEKQLLERHTATLLEKGFHSLMQGNRIQDLSRMYTLLSRVGKLEALRASLAAWIKKVGGELIMDSEKEAELVNLLLNLKAKLDTILQDAFQQNESFSNTMKESFEHFINLKSNRPAELIAKFIDLKLRTGNKGLSEEEMEMTLDAVLTLFRFIQGKDVFEAFYKKDLSKRLLLGKSASIDAERSMITKLKTECGSQFTSHLEGMFKDIDLSRDIVASFKHSSQARANLPPNMDMLIHVLTQGYWPTYPPTEVRLPVELEKYQEVFREFYLSKHSGRRLHWQNSLAHCVLRVAFPRGTKELVVSLFQTVVLMLFQSQDELSFKDIQEGSGIELKELKRTLQSLACGKVRVLVKNPKGRDVDEGDVFRFNSDFTEKLFRIKVNNIQLKESSEENQATSERVFQDRQYQIDAAIVRIMKTRKTLSHTLLITELYKQLQFPIKPADLKKRIESLIDREYLERDENDAKVYIYLA